MLPEIAPRFKPEQERVEALIRAAFAGVTRDGGVSWTESVVIDGDGSYRTTGEARAEDKETHWEQLVDDPHWHHEVGIGGFTFLDAIGWRYYIAPAMIRCTRDPGTELVHALGIEWSIGVEQSKLITRSQADAILAFLSLMITIGDAQDTSGLRYLREYLDPLGGWIRFRPCT